MEGYDVLMLVLIVVTTLYGAHKGLAWQIASIASIFVSYGAAYRFRGEVASLINAEAPWNMFLAMLVLYVGSSLGIWLLFRLLNDFIERLKLKEFDRQMGALLGFAKGVILCSIVTLFAVTLLGDTQRRAIVRAKSGHYIVRFLHDADPIMPAEIKDVLDPYLENLERRLETEGNLADDESPNDESDQGLFGRSDRPEGSSDEESENPITSAVERALEEFTPARSKSNAEPKDRDPASTGRRILNNVRRWTE